MGKVKYKKCPRCELNYIPDSEDMCDVCKAELGLSSKLTLLDDILDEEEPLKLCPVCKTAYIGLEEDMCENCLALAEHETDPLIADTDDDDWRTYLDDEPDDIEPVEIPLEELDEEFKDDEEDFDDEENIEAELADYPDDFDDFDDLDDIDTDYEEDDDEML